MVDLPSGKLQTAGLKILDADLPVDGSASSIDDVKEALAKLRDKKLTGICNINAKLLKDGVRP